METLCVFIRYTTTENTGGNCMADVLELKSGPVIFITDEMIGLCKSMTEWREGPSENYRGLPYEDVESVARVDAPSERSPCNLTFVERLTVYEPDGPVSVDLVVLADGRVLGIDSETMVLYPSMEAFDNSMGATYPPFYPSIAIAEDV